MKITFSTLVIKNTRVHQLATGYELMEINGEDVVRIIENDVTAQYHGGGWAHIEGLMWRPLGLCEGSFLREPMSDGSTVWLDPIYYCQRDGRFHGRLKDKPSYAHLGLLDRESFKIEGYPGCRFLPGISWLSILALRDKNKGVRAYLIKQFHAPTAEPINYATPDRVMIGPWGFYKDSSHFTGSRIDLVDSGEIPQPFREAYELKRWLHGLKSKHDSNQEVVKRAVRRRLMKHRATPSDIEFFQTIFGASQVGRWVQEASTKNQKHEHASN